MKPYLFSIDTQTSGPRCDVTPLFADPGAFAQLTADLAAPFRNAAVDYVAGIDALGFILGTAVAIHLGVGLLAVRKGGKLPVATRGRELVDYSGQSKRLEIRTDILAPGDHVLLIDEWIETGAQVEAAAALIEGQGAVVAGIASIRMDTCARTDALSRKYRVHTVWEDGPPEPAVPSSH